MQNFQHELHMLSLDNYQVREVIPIGLHQNSRLFGGFGCGGFGCGGFGCGGFGCGGFGCGGFGCGGCFGFGFGCFGIGFGFI
ncbi:heterocycloanthracin/sonorensin family bacteriocin [Bacillus salipaludis]|uniref:heterocycloanthracin/sonorensin family bacteriocin n=1 Tax=Bacillus salipaludis TaxID=2547811 RepID=UPI003D223A61